MNFSSQVALHTLPLMPGIFQCPLLHGLTEMEPLPIIPMDTLIDTGPEGRPEGSRMWAPSSSRAAP